MIARAAPSPYRQNAATAAASEPAALDVRERNLEVVIEAWLKTFGAATRVPITALEPQLESISEMASSLSGHPLFTLAP